MGELRISDRDKETRQILNWLAPVNYGSTQSDTIRRRADGTGRWFLESEQYQAWLQTPCQTLFCPGIPGAGKTVLVSIVIEDLRKQFHNEPSVGIAYIYFNFRQTNTQTFEHILGSILKQLTQGCTSVSADIQEPYTKHKSEGTQLSSFDLLKAFSPVAALFSRVFIILDALDECDDGCRPHILQGVFNLQEANGTNILVTSRPHIDIKDQAKEYTVLGVHANDADVGKYLGDHISELPSFVQKRTDLQQQIKGDIIQATNGM